MRVRLAVTPFLFAFGAASVAFALPSAIVIVRHAEKAADSNEASVPLSEEGRARAERLARVLSTTGVSAIYATETDRARQTAEPLARAARLDVRPYSPRDAAGKSAPRLLLDRLKKEAPSGTVVVVAHSNTVPEILAALGHPQKIEIASSQYDDLFVVVPKAAGGPPTVVRLKY